VENNTTTKPLNQNKMVNARLNIICGNCGSKEMFTYNIVEEMDDDTEELKKVVYVGCDNCHTIYCLNDYAKQFANNKSE